MARWDDIHVPRPIICPGCGENMLENRLPGIDPYGPANLYYIQDGEDVTVVKGWVCFLSSKSATIFGTVVAKTDPKTGKLTDCDPPMPSHTFALNAPNRKVSIF